MPDSKHESSSSALVLYNSLLVSAGPTADVLVTTMGEGNMPIFALTVAASPDVASAQVFGPLSSSAAMAFHSDQAVVDTLTPPANLRSNNDLLSLTVDVLGQLVVNPADLLAVSSGVLQVAISPEVGQVTHRRPAWAYHTPITLTILFSISFSITGDRSGHPQPFREP